VTSGNVESMFLKIWSAQELDALSGAEREKIFKDSLVYDLAVAPPALVARAQEFVLGRIANESSPS
jgi:hypothetical protein